MDVRHRCRELSCSQTERMTEWKTERTITLLRQPWPSNKYGDRHKPFAEVAKQKDRKPKSIVRPLSLGGGNKLNRPHWDTYAFADGCGLAWHCLGKRHIMISDRREQFFFVFTVERRLQHDHYKLTLFTITNSLRHANKYPAIFAKTTKFQNSFICYGLSHYQLTA